MDTRNHKGMTDASLTLASEIRPPAPAYPETAVGYYNFSPGLGDFLDIIIRRKWIVIASVLLVFMPSLIYNLTVDPIYQATCQVELSSYPTRVTKFEEVVDPFGRGKTFIETQIALLQSPALADRVASRLNLKEHPLFSPPPMPQDEAPGLLQRLKAAVLFVKKQVLAAVKSWFTSKEKNPAPNPELRELSKLLMIRGYLLQNLKVTPNGDADIVTITFDSEDPSLARDVANALVNEFMIWQMDRKIEATKTAKIQLDRQIEIARRELENTESKLNAFAKESGIVSLDTRLNHVYQELEQITAALAKVEADRIAIEQSYELASKSDLDTSPLVQKNDIIHNLRVQYLALLSEYEKLKVRYKDEHPAMKTLKAAMLEVGSRINSEQERILTTIRNDYLATVNTEKALRATAEEKKAAALQLNDLVSQYKNLERDVEVNKQIYQSLLGRSKEIDANVGTDLTNIKVVDFATLPLKPYQPNVPRNLFVALVLGLVLGVGTALVREHMDNSIRRVEEMPGRFWIPVLGVVPVASKQDKNNLPSLVRDNPSSPFSEAIRMIRVAIQHSASLDHLHRRTLLLTSSVKGEGKSTLSSNLALSFALAGEKTLLVEADLRRPSLSQHFAGNGKSKGLADFLKGVAKYEEIVQKTSLSNLYFIPSGTPVTNPTELLGSTAMRELLHTAAAHFDRVIFDGPPFTSDALTLGSLVDGVILVATLGRTHRDALRVLREDLAATQADLVGSIINMLSGSRFSSTAFYHNYYKGYENTYGRPHRNLPARVGR
ncbi:MAG: polysaccharide biosynthesis tyrosine autokinase [Desulfosoma sp.]